MPKAKTPAQPDTKLQNLSGGVPATEVRLPLDEPSNVVVPAHGVQGCVFSFGQFHRVAVDLDPTLPEPVTILLSQQMVPGRSCCAGSRGVGDPDVGPPKHLSDFGIREVTAPHRECRRSASRSVSTEGGSMRSEMVRPEHSLEARLYQFVTKEEHI